MTRDESLRPSDAIALAMCGWQCLFSGVAIALSALGDGWVWFAGQVLLAINMVQWFILLHDLSHGRFFETAWLNDVFGHVASVFCLVPFWNWTLMHEQHHQWNGWKDKDPSDARAVLRSPSRLVIAVMNAAWKYWIPILTLTFVAINFWTLPRLYERFQDMKSRVKVTFSLLFMVGVLGALFLLFGRAFLWTWAPATFLLLMVSDPLLLTQHAHIDANYAEGEAVRKFRFNQQGSFARTLIYPEWVSRFLFYRSEQHVLHHLHPEVPLYRLANMAPVTENSIPWRDWLRSAKRLPADVLIFQTASDTGVRI